MAETATRIGMGNRNEIFKMQAELRAGAGKDLVRLEEHSVDLKCVHLSHNARDPKNSFCPSD